MFFRKKSEAAAPPGLPTGPAVVDGELDIRALGRHLWRRKGRIIGVTLIFAAATFVVVNLITPQFRSESRLLLESHQNVFLRADADKNIDPSIVDQEAVTSQIQVVLSRDLARAVIKKMNLANKPEFDPALAGNSRVRKLLSLIGIGRDPSTMTKEERTLEAYYDHLNVYAIDKSRVIVIDFTSADPLLASNVANTVATTYLQMQQEAKQAQTRAAGTWLAGEIEKMRLKVAAAEAKVEQYRAKSNLFVGPNNSSLPAQQLSDINAQIAAARGQQADLEARAKQLRALIKSGKLVDSSDIANSQTMRTLVDQRMALQAQLAEQSTTLLGRHPRILELKAQIAEVDRLIRNEAERLARQLDNDAVVAGDRINTLTASLDQVKHTASRSNEQDVELRALQREAKTQRDLLESYLSKYREASARDSISAAPPEARIISTATPAIKPAYPKKLPMVLIAAFAGFALSSGFTVAGVLLAAPSSAAYGYGYAPVNFDVPGGEALPMPTMPQAASPPLVPPTVSPPAERVEPSLAPAAPAGHALLSPMPTSTIEQVAKELRQAGNAGRRVAMIGTMRNVGTTFAAIKLARALADDASVVLVDLALAAPNLSVISTEPSAPGIAELVHGEASFADIIMRDQYSRVHVVATGRVGEDGAALAASPMLASAIEALVRSYDHVVIDAGSATDVEIERLVPLASRAVLVSLDPTAPATQAVCERLMTAGFAEVSVLAGGSQAAAA